MVTLLEFIKTIEAQSIIYVHGKEQLPLELFDLINDIDSKIWMVLLTRKGAIKRQKGKYNFEVVYNSFFTYNQLIRFDVAFVSNSLFEGQDLSKFCKNAITLSAYRKKFIDSTKEFYFPSNYISWLPLRFQAWLTQISLFRDKTLKYVLRKY